ncbi:MAG: DUF4157 domain-containing protein [Chitinivibrionales bacterium]|nr:DUF4157 domain-containing protein [Chitinivibrionales bacterium]MBD3358930.1 DUF4157 domain-containing protein [Chitinivibrionales bacterium]
MVKHAKPKNKCKKPAGAGKPEFSKEAPQPVDKKKTFRSKLSYRNQRSPAVPLAAPVQKKVTVGRAGDPYEREADTVADHVVAGKRAPAISRIPAGGLRTQRGPEKNSEVQELAAQLTSEESVEEQEEREGERRSLSPGGSVQKQPEEVEEPPAESAVQSQANGAFNEGETQERSAQARESESVSEQDSHDGGGTATVRAQSSDSEGMAEERNSVQEQKDDTVSETPAERSRTQAVRSVPEQERKNAVATRAVRNRDGGEPLSPHTRERLEGSLGVDLSHVRVHADSRAHESNKDLRAKAFTHKNHIWLGRGTSRRDLKLMAHEAAHVVQQGGANEGRVPTARRTSGLGREQMNGPRSQENAAEGEGTSGSLNGGTSGGDTKSMGIA